MVYIHYGILLFIILLSIPIFTFSVQIVAAIFSKKCTSTKELEDCDKPSVAIIVPAHNEERVISNTLKEIIPQLSSLDQLIVVADNCTDNTASIAAEMGATVLERFNHQFKGKGYALDFAMQHLKSNPPDVVIIIDADCSISSNLVYDISTQCVMEGKPIQANYLMTFQDRVTLKQQVTEFAWMVKNSVRPSGFQYLGLPCQLMGTGMAFNWKDLSLCNLANSHLVEDMQLGLEFASLGKAPMFSTRAYVHSYFPNSEEGQLSQRARWEHGHLSIILSKAPYLIIKSALTKDKQLFAQVLDLVVPPVALLLIMVMATFMLSLLDWLISDSLISVLLSAALLSLLGASVMLAWYFFARTIIGFRSILLAPIILLMKLPIYIGFLFNRQLDWVRTKRD